MPGVRISYASEQVATATKVMNARIIRKDAFPKLAFELVNFTRASIPVEYKVQWVDVDGAPLQSTAAWQQTTVSGMEAKPGRLDRQVHERRDRLCHGPLPDER